MVVPLTQISIVLNSTECTPNWVENIQHYLIESETDLLQQDKAKPHTSRQTKEKIKELKAIELLPHPAYSPDLAPSDYHLFRSMAHFLRGGSFNNSDDIENGCREFFASKDKEWYRRGIKQLADRWLQTI